LIDDVIRHPVAAGMFYENNRDRLLKQMEGLFLHKLGPGKLPSKKFGVKRESIGYTSPHAGYMYSGPVAAHTYYRLSQEKVPDTIIIIGPNHTGLGPAVSMAPWKEWETPLGRIEVDTELRDYFVRKSKLIYPEYSAHLYEHSIEVQLPFIQYIYEDKDVRILPFSVLNQMPFIAEKLASEIEEAVKTLDKDVIIIASTDMTHYEPHDTARKKDLKAFEMMQTLDHNKFFEYITRNNVSMCGPLGVMVLMILEKKRGGKTPELLKYSTSGEVTGDLEAVVGYLSARFPA
jgi:AmmeMemoRadiSam system protein B